MTHIHSHLDQRERETERGIQNHIAMYQKEIYHIWNVVYFVVRAWLFFFKSIVCLLCLTKSQNCSLACCSLLLTLMSLLISTKWWKLLVIVQIFSPLFIIDIVLHLLAVLISQAFKIRLKNYSPVYHTFRIFHWHWQLLRRLSWHHTT